MRFRSRPQRRRCSPMTLVSGNVRFMRIFAGVPWRVGAKRQRAIENMDFRGFRMLRFRHLRKWGQHYYIVLFSPLSPFHWPQNTWPWPWMAWMAIYVKFSLLRTDFESIIGWLREYYLLIYCSVCWHIRDQRRCGKRSSGPWSAEYLESAEKLRICRRRYIVRTLTNKANFSI